jgi:hypothetical protein
VCVPVQVGGLRQEAIGQLQQLGPVFEYTEGFLKTAARMDEPDFVRCHPPYPTYSPVSLSSAYQFKFAS